MGQKMLKIFDPNLLKFTCNSTACLLQVIAVSMSLESTSMKQGEVAPAMI